MSATLKSKGPEALERLPSRVQSNPTKDQEMNVITDITPAAAAKVYAACTEANNIAALIAFVARTAKEHAYQADDAAFPKFHEIRMALEGAERLLSEHAESLDVLSTGIAIGSAAQ